MSRAIRWLSLIGLLTLLGCSRTAPAPKREEFENLAKIQQAYTDAFNNLGRAPRNLQEFRPYLAKYGNADELLISSHDKQPYEFRWGVSLRSLTESKKPPIIAFEQQGVKGERYVLTTAGIVTMTDAELEREKQSKIVEFGIPQKKQ